MTGRSQDASVFSTCHGKFLLTATVGLVIFCFTATTTAVCYICVTLPSMQFARLLRCIYLLGCRRFLALYWSDNTGNVSLFKKDRNHFWSSSSNISGSNTCLASVTIRGQNCRDQPRQYRATETKTLYFNLEKVNSQTWLFIYLFFLLEKKILTSHVVSLFLWRPFWKRWELERVTRGLGFEKSSESARNFTRKNGAIFFQIFLTVPDICVIRFRHRCVNRFQNVRLLTNSQLVS